MFRYGDPGRSYGYGVYGGQDDVILDFRLSVVRAAGDVFPVSGVPVKMPDQRNTVTLASVTGTVDVVDLHSRVRLVKPLT